VVTVKPIAVASKAAAMICSTEPGVLNFCHKFFFSSGISSA